MQAELEVLKSAHKQHENAVKRDAYTGRYSTYIVKISAIGLISSTKLIGSDHCWLCT